MSLSFLICNIEKSLYLINKHYDIFLVMLPLILIEIFKILSIFLKKHIAILNNFNFFLTLFTLYFFIAGIQEKTLDHLYAYSVIYIRKHSKITFSLVQSVHDAMGNYRAGIVALLSFFAIIEPSAVSNASAQNLFRNWIILGFYLFLK